MVQHDSFPVIKLAIPKRENEMYLFDQFAKKKKGKVLFLPADVLEGKSGEERNCTNAEWRS